MAMYYQGGSEIQGDGLQTLYLMNPNYIGFSESTLQQQQPPPPPSAGSMMFMNSGNALHAGGMPHARVPQSQHFVGVPLPTAVPLHDPNRSLWTAVDHTGSGSMGQPQIPSAGGTTDFASQLGFHRSAHQQGLSLSLSPQQQHPFRSLQMESPVGLLSARAAADNIRDSGASSSSITTGISGFISGSKYLKAAQELLDEVVNVENTVEEEAANKERAKLKKESMCTFGGGGGGDSPITGGENRAAELTTAQRQELQMKKAKLMSMLEEVEQRDRQYNQQMEVMVASFEQAAGVGAAKSYTHLALKTISRQFRCLKVAIASQIKATGKSLGEEAHGLLLGGTSSNSSRLLKFVNQNHQLHQHFGMMQPNAWRPQRGLPERAVSVLRAWLFEHFLHPYPKDSDKIMLAKQTGLTRSQVSNWFINARVRLWKPMVEEMYTEEMKGQDQHGKDQNATKRNNEANNKEPSSCPEKASITCQDPQPLQQQQQQQPQQGAFSFINIENNSSAAEIRNGKKPRSEIHSSPSSIVSADMEFTADRQGSSAPENYPDLLAAANAANGFGGFSMGDFGRFNPENLAPGFHPNNGSVSLTLGLPPSESQQNYLSTHQDMDLGRRLDMGAEWE